MKFIITESKYENVKNTIKKSISQIGLIETLRRYKLPMESLDYVLEKEEGEYFSPKQLRNVLIYYVLIVRSLPDWIEIDEYKIYLDKRFENVSFDFCEIGIIKNRDGGPARIGVSGHFSPFAQPSREYEPFCQIDFSWFTKGDYRDYDNLYFESDKYNKGYRFEAPKISSMKELKDWYLNDLPKQSIQQAETYIDYVLEEENI
jgi:hypothetical protein